MCCCGQSTTTPGGGFEGLAGGEGVVQIRVGQVKQTLETGRRGAGGGLVEFGVFAVEGVAVLVEADEIVAARDRQGDVLIQFAAAAVSNTNRVVQGQGFALFEEIESGVRGGETPRLLAFATGFVRDDGVQFQGGIQHVLCCCGQSTTTPGGGFEGLAGGEGVVQIRVGQVKQTLETGRRGAGGGFVEFRVLAVEGVAVLVEGGQVVDSRQCHGHILIQLAILPVRNTNCVDRRQGFALFEKVEAGRWRGAELPGQAGGSGCCVLSGGLQSQLILQNR